jgi:phospholipase C
MEPETRHPIEHVVVLMLENRSFDQVLGCLRAVHPGVDGIVPKTRRWNRGVSGEKVLQHPCPAGEVDVEQRPEPKNGKDNVLRQLAGDNGGFVLDYTSAPGAAATGDQQHQVMRYFALGQLPALHALGRHFTVCDRWHASVPGPSWANRLFAHAATTQGAIAAPRVADGLPANKMETIFDRLDAHHVSWSVYFGDFPLTLLLGRLRSWRRLRHFRRFSRFEADVARPAEELPAYVFIEPSYLYPGRNDGHPGTPVLRADDLVARVYDSLRANERLWSRTLLVVLFSEHGGAYDHVPPPAATPPGDGSGEYAFDRLGVRVPAILVSPWVGAGVFSETLDHTSLLRYLDARFGLGGPLNPRMAAAGDLSPAIRTEGEPRTDTPERIGTARIGRAYADPPRDLTDLQRTAARACDAIHRELVPERHHRRSTAAAAEDPAAVARRVRVQVDDLLEKASRTPD